MLASNLLGGPEKSERVKKVNVALVPTPADSQGLLLLWKRLNSRTSVLTRMEGRKITYELDSDAGDLGFKTDFFCYSKRTVSSPVVKWK